MSRYREIYSKYSTQLYVEYINWIYISLLLRYALPLLYTTLVKYLRNLLMSRHIFPKAQTFNKIEFVNGLEYITDADFLVVSFLFFSAVRR
jgi:hypothetical protein